MKALVPFALLVSSLVFVSCQLPSPPTKSPEKTIIIRESDSEKSLKKDEKKERKLKNKEDSPDKKKKRSEKEKTSGK